MKFSFPKGRRTVFFGATLALLLTAAIPAIALAAPQDTKCGTDIACVKKFGDDAIAKRQTSLDAATTKINGFVSKGALTSTQADRCSIRSRRTRAVSPASRRSWTARRTSPPRARM